LDVHALSLLLDERGDRGVERLQQVVSGLDVDRLDDVIVDGANELLEEWMDEV
jgi:hypothetical protein